MRKEIALAQQQQEQRAKRNREESGPTSHRAGPCHRPQASSTTGLQAPQLQAIRGPCPAAIPAAARSSDTLTKRRGERVARPPGASVVVRGSGRPGPAAGPWTGQSVRARRRREKPARRLQWGTHDPAQKCTQYGQYVEHEDVNYRGPKESIKPECPPLIGRRHYPLGGNGGGEEGGARGSRSHPCWTPPGGSDGQALSAWPAPAPRRRRRDARREDAVFVVVVVPHREINSRPLPRKTRALSLRGHSGDRSEGGGEGVVALASG